MSGRTYTSSSHTHSENKHLYQQKERDIETDPEHNPSTGTYGESGGLDYFEARFYDSEIARFTTVDPHGNRYTHINGYASMNNNPINIIDPTGMDPLLKPEPGEWEKKDDWGATVEAWFDDSMRQAQWSAANGSGSVEEAQGILQAEADHWDNVNRKATVDDGGGGYMVEEAAFDPRWAAFVRFCERVGASPTAQRFAKWLEKYGNKITGVATNSNKIQRVLPNVQKAVFDMRKLTEYALNMSHPSGKNKAHLFNKLLGITKENAGYLHNQVMTRLPNSQYILGKLDKYGQRYTVDMMIPHISESGSAWMVRTGWIIKENVPHLTTIMIK